ncbi:hypothetical protein HGB07_08935 [Candidatus Roizmanbacteria bacterium]|nr:hypothetical protein [Candidatus Roizmanbacteria bacterium]
MPLAQTIEIGAAQGIIENKTFVETASQREVNDLEAGGGRRQGVLAAMMGRLTNETRRNLQIPAASGEVIQLQDELQKDNLILPQKRDQINRYQVDLKLIAHIANKSPQDFRIYFPAVTEGVQNVIQEVLKKTNVASDKASVRVYELVGKMLTNPNYFQTVIQPPQGARQTAYTEFELDMRRLRDTDMGLFDSMWQSVREQVENGKLQAVGIRLTSAELRNRLIETDPEKVLSQEEEEKLTKQTIEMRKKLDSEKSGISGKLHNAISQKLNDIAIDLNDKRNGVPPNHAYLISGDINRLNEIANSLRELERQLQKCNYHRRQKYDAQNHRLIDVDSPDFQAMRDLAVRANLLNGADINDLESIYSQWTLIGNVEYAEGTDSALLRQVDQYGVKVNKDSRELLGHLDNKESFKSLLRKRGSLYAETDANGKIIKIKFDKLYRDVMDIAEDVLSVADNKHDKFFDEANLKFLASIFDAKPGDLMLILAGDEMLPTPMRRQGLVNLDQPEEFAFFIGAQ